MNKTLKGILFWTPRIGSILFVLFLSLFAFDVFEARLGFWGTAGALLLHLLPSILLAAAIACVRLHLGIVPLAVEVVVRSAQEAIEREAVELVPQPGGQPAAQARPP